jgi:outer membrane protein assembly complex protein YaeT
MGVIDAQRLADVQNIIENALVKKRYFGFQIESSVEVHGEDAKTVAFKINPGSPYDELRAKFEGVHSIPESELQELLKKVGFFDYGQEERNQAAPSIENLYRERGYLDVKVEPPASQLDAKTRTVTSVFRVSEGKLYRFGDVRFQGNAEFSNSDLSMRIQIGPETPFLTPVAQKALQTLEELYQKTGYSDAEIVFTQVKNVSGKVVDIAFNIQEGRQRKVKEIQVEGNKKTSSGLVRSQLALEPGDILSDDKLSVARNNLYESGAYSFVETEVTPLPPTADLKPNQVPVRLVVRVREIQPWDLNYGGYYDTVRGPGIVTDISNRNMLGNARVVGLRVRYDGQLREGRMYFSQPMLRRFPVKSLFSAFTNREETTDAVTNRQIITYKKGLSPTFEYYVHRNRENVLTLGYRVEITHSSSVVPDISFPDIDTRTAPVTSSFTRDTRDNVLDATRGHFTSHALDWGSSKLGSDLNYTKYFGQFFDYVRLGKPSRVPWAQTIRNRYVFAYGVRVGLLRRREGEDFRSEQFKTGGGTTVRGFDQDRLGPLDQAGNPTGGDGVLILNSELRFPVYKFFEGVGFVDAGNVYRRLGEFDPFDLRASYGFGLRVRTPYILLRFDFGLNMNRRPTEPQGKFFFSIGQAF